MKTILPTKLKIFPLWLFAEKGYWFPFLFLFLLHASRSLSSSCFIFVAEGRTRNALRKVIEHEHKIMKTLEAKHRIVEDFPKQTSHQIDGTPA